MPESLMQFSLRLPTFLGRPLVDEADSRGISVNLVLREMLMDRYDLSHDKAPAPEPEGRDAFPGGL